MLSYTSNTGEVAAPRTYSRCISVPTQGCMMMGIFLRLTFLGLHFSRTSKRVSPIMFSKWCVVGITGGEGGCGLGREKRNACSFTYTPFFISHRSARLQGRCWRPQCCSDGAPQLGVSHWESLRSRPAGLAGVAWA
jgi:hypothetical protein